MAISRKPEGSKVKTVMGVREGVTQHLEVLLVLKFKKQLLKKKFLVRASCRKGDV